jgi:hypothetical protein
MELQMNPDIQHEIEAESMVGCVDSDKCHTR